MRTDDYFISGNLRRKNYLLKMTKVRTVTFLMLIISTCALVLSLAEAYPTVEITAEPNATLPVPDAHNTTRLVISNVLKTIEFEVALVEDDGTNDDFENVTDGTTPGYIETDIKLLNVNLLKELIERATPDETATEEAPPEEATAR